MMRHQPLGGVGWTSYFLLLTSRDHALSLAFFFCTLAFFFQAFLDRRSVGAGFDARFALFVALVQAVLQTFEGELFVAVL